MRPPRVVRLRRGIGAFGQFIVVDPAHDLVVVQLSVLPWEGDRSLVDFVLDAFAEAAPES
jgi:hypothetical protein